MMKNYIFFVEGVHDASCISKIFRMNNLKTAKNLDDIPKIWKDRVPKPYQYDVDILDRFRPIPDYYLGEDVCVIVVVSNGTQNILKEVDLYLSNMNKYELNQIGGICMIFDADQKPANNKIKEILKDIDKRDYCFSSEDFIKKTIKRYKETIKLHYYFFPDNEHSGTLENFLLEGAKVVYSGLIDHVDNYISKIDEKYKFNWSISSENKVKIGCIANVFRPGSANQVSIFRDDWISKESVEKSEVIRKFYEFIVDIISQ